MLVRPLHGDCGEQRPFVAPLIYTPFAANARAAAAASPVLIASKKAITGAAGTGTMAVCAVAQSAVSAISKAAIASARPNDSIARLFAPGFHTTCLRRYQDRR